MIDLTLGRTFDFQLEMSFSDNKNLEVIKSVKLLGLVISESLSWEENTDYICKKARKDLDSKRHENKWRKSITTCRCLPKRGGVNSRVSSPCMEFRNNY